MIITQIVNDPIMAAGKIVIHASCLESFDSTPGMIRMTMGAIKEKINKHN
jgi:hypothetical protein